MKTKVLILLSLLGAQIVFSQPSSRLTSIRKYNYFNLANNKVLQLTDSALIFNSATTGAGIDFEMAKEFELGSSDYNMLYLYPSFSCDSINCYLLINDSVVNAATIVKSSDAQHKVGHVSMIPPEDTWPYKYRMVNMRFYNGKPVNEEYKIYDTSKHIWEDAVRTLYTYKGDKLTTKEQQGGWKMNTWSTGGKTDYYYNIATNNLDSEVTSLPDPQKTVYYYDNNNRVKTREIYTYSSSGKEYRNRWEIGYNNDGDLINTVYSDDVKVYGKIERVYDNLHHCLQETGLFYSNGNFAPRKQYNAKYDSYGHVTEMDVLFWNKNKSAWEIVYDSACNTASVHLVFTYEPYTIPTAITNNSISSNFIVYPSPADNSIRIDVTLKAAEEITVNICDMAGRVIRLWKEPAIRHYTNIISTADLPDGNYIIKLDSKSEQLKQRLTVMH